MLGLFVAGLSLLVAVAAEAREYRLKQLPVPRGASSSETRSYRKIIIAVTGTGFVIGLIFVIAGFAA